MTLLSMRGVSKRYGGVQALSGIDLDISAGEFTAVIGPNGAGKSTLLNVMTRLTPLSGGSIAFEDGLAWWREPSAGARAA